MGFKKQIVSLLRKIEARKGLGDKALRGERENQNCHLVLIERFNYNARLINSSSLSTRGRKRSSRDPTLIARGCYDSTLGLIEGLLL